MFMAQDDGYWGESAPKRYDNSLSPAEAVLIWGLRRMVPTMIMHGPMARCASVETALIRQFGEHGQEIGILLRCLTQLLAAGAARPLHFACPAMATLTPDETTLLTALQFSQRSAPAIRCLFATASVSTATRLLEMLSALTQSHAHSA